MPEYQHNLNEVKAKAKGLWFQIIPSIVPEFSSAANAPGLHVPCPVHGGIDGFRFFTKGADDGMGICNSCHGKKPLDGIGLIMWATGWNLPETLKAVADCLESVDPGEAASIKSKSISQVSKPANASGRMKAIKKQWGDASPDAHEPARLYFQRRGLASVPVMRSIRYHAGIPFQFRNKGLLTDDQGNWLTWPAIICAIRGAEGNVGIHQTYLTKTGEKATGEIQQAIAERFGAYAAAKSSCRKFFSPLPLSGGAVRFGAAGAVLGVGEGLETMLAVQQMTGSMSLAACCTGSLLENIDIPGNVRKVIIFADKDRNGAGLNAAKALRDRLLQEQETRVQSVEIKLPELAIPDDAKGVDWLDVLNSGRMSFEFDDIES